MQHRTHHLLFHGAGADAINCCDVTLFHVLQSEEDEYVARAQVELVKGCEGTRERFLSQHDTLGRPILHVFPRQLARQCLIELDVIATAACTLPRSIAQKVRRHLENEGLRILDLQTVICSQNANEHLLGKILSIGEVADPSQKEAHKRASEAPVKRR
jgi:hypothetical protein